MSAHPELVPVKNALAMERFRLAVTAVSFAWCSAKTTRLEGKRFDIEILDRERQPVARLDGLTRHELEIVSTVLEAIRRGEEVRS
jgi:hypothetical protein